MKDEECWKECEYANPKSEIISAYLMMKKENEELRLQNQNLVVMLEQERTLKSEEKSLQEICRLEQQIEKMKLCQNCKYWKVLSCDEPCLYCSRCFANEGKERLKDYWELAG